MRDAKERKLVKLYFQLSEDENGYPPDRVETLWAEQTGPAEYKVDNIPFYVRGISSGDIVSADRDDDGQLNFREILQKSGNSVFRLYIFDEEEIISLRQTIREMGYESEQSNVPNLIAVEIPENKSIKPFIDLIVEQAEAKNLEYQEAALRHSIREAVRPRLTT